MTRRGWRAGTGSLALDKEGVGETERGHVWPVARLAEAALEQPAAAPVLRLWHHLNSLTLQVTTRSIALDRWPRDRRPLRVLHLSDLHLTANQDPAWWLRRLEHVSVDAIALSGDLIQDDTGLAACRRFLEGIRGHAPMGTYVTLGNHDYLNYSTARQANGRVVQQRTRNDVAVLRAIVREAGATLLDNEAVELCGGTPPLWIVGVSDPYTGHDDMPTALAPVPRGALMLMLAHSPDQLPEAADHGVDLMVGGHTHGGQVCLPLVGPLRTATLGPLRLASGYARYGSTHCFISRGMGTASLPLRVLCPPEATVLTPHVP